MVNPDDTSSARVESWQGAEDNPKTRLKRGQVLMTTCFKRRAAGLRITPLRTGFSPGTMSIILTNFERNFDRKGMLEHFLS